MKNPGPDVLLINPGNRYKIYQGLGRDLAALENPVWAGLLASFLSASGYSVEILDCNALSLSPEEAASAVDESDPLLTVMVVYGHNPSASTMVMPSSGETARAIKALNPARKILFLGGHVAALPERTLREEAADYTCTGEGFYTIAELVDCLKVGDDPVKVRGLCLEREGEIVETPSPPIVTDLTNLVPGHSFDLLPMERYRAHNWHCFGHLQKRKPYAAIYTTLGCPYKCSYCCIQAPFRRGEAAAGFKEGRNSYRRWSPEIVLSWIDELVQKYGVTNIKIADEIFALNRSHVLGICDGIYERGYDLNIWAYARVDTVDKEFLERMRRGGVRWLCFGIESGSQRVRDDVSKGYRQESLFKAMELVKEAGIYVIANYLFGLPEEDESSMRETLDLSKELCCEFANFYCTMAYPGSRLYDEALESGLPLPESWQGYSQLSKETLPLPTRHLTGEQVLSFRDKAFQEYFNDKAYLSMIGRVFGEETVKHISRMSSVPMERECFKREKALSTTGEA